MEQEEQRGMRRWHSRRAMRVIAVAGLVAIGLSGCIYRSKEKVVPTAGAPVVVAPSATERVVTSPDGRWQLYGDGTVSSPHFWAWIPAGTNPPPPPPLPRM